MLKKNKTTKEKKSTSICDYKGKKVEKENGRILVHLLKESVLRLLQTLFHNHVTYRLKMTPGIKQF